MLQLIYINGMTEHPRLPPHAVRPELYWNLSAADTPGYKVTGKPAELRAGRTFKVHQCSENNNPMEALLNGNIVTAFLAATRTYLGPLFGPDWHPAMYACSTLDHDRLPTFAAVYPPFHAGDS